MENTEVDKVGKINEFKVYKQSANVFLHCMKRIGYLKEILKNKAIILRYNVENIEYLQLKAMEEIAFPMICFCDIFLTRIKWHMMSYGKYGIGLDKNFCIAQGMNPIHYVNEHSQLVRDLRGTMLKLCQDIDATNEVYCDQLMHNLLYMKPICGPMKIGNNQNKQTLFIDEREWRYIPKIDASKTEMELVLYGDEKVSEKIKLYSDAMKYYKYGWLYLNVDTIKYILVRNDRDVVRMIKYIKKLDSWNEEEKSILISKLIRYDTLKEDM